MNYIDVIAADIYRLSETGHDWHSEMGQGLYRLYAVLALAKGKETTCEDVHNAWAAWVVPLQPNHRSLVPYDRLTPEVQALDQPYVDAIHAVSRGGANA